MSFADYFEIVYSCQVCDRFTIWNQKILGPESNYGIYVSTSSAHSFSSVHQHGELQPSIRGPDHCPIYIDLHGEPFSWKGFLEKRRRSSLQMYLGSDAATTVVDIPIKCIHLDYDPKPLPPSSQLAHSQPPSSPQPSPKKTQPAILHPRKRGMIRQYWLNTRLLYATSILTPPMSRRNWRIRA